MSAKIITRWGNSRVRMIDFVGRITCGEGSALLRDTVQEEVSNNHNSLIVNFAEVSYIDATGLAELVSANELVTKNGGQLKLLNLARRVKDLLQITKLYTTFEVYENESVAIRSFYY